MINPLVTWDWIIPQLLLFIQRKNMPKVVLHTLVSIVMSFCRKLYSWPCTNTCISKGRNEHLTSTKKEWKSNNYFDVITANFQDKGLQNYAQTTGFNCCFKRNRNGKCWELSLSWKLMSLLFIVTVVPSQYQCPKDCPKRKYMAWLYISQTHSAHQRTSWCLTLLLSLPLFIWKKGRTYGLVKVPTT